MTDFQFDEESYFFIGIAIFLITRIFMINEFVAIMIL